MAQVDLLVALDSQQRQAVCAPIPSVRIVKATPGSGKTRTLTYRAAYMVKQGVEPSQILCVTFTNAAAEEMRGRLRRLVGEQAAGEMLIATLHAASSYILREMASRQFAIYDEQDQLLLLERMMTPDDVQAGRSREVLEAIARAKAKTPCGQDPAEELPESIRPLYARYQGALRAVRAMDFEDLIRELWIALQDPALLQVVHGRLRHVLVDEAQDLSRSQIDLVLALVSPEQPSLFAVGDPCQAIFSWRGACPESMDRLAHSVPGAVVMELSTNYRSTPQIVEASRRLFSPALRMVTPRSPGEPIRAYRFDADYQEAQFVVQDIRRRLQGGIQAGEVAVLFRARSLLPVLEAAFVERGVPYELTGGTTLLARPEIRGVLAYARAALHPQDRASMDRVLAFPPRGIGEVRRSLILQRLDRGASLEELAQDGRLRAVGEELVRTGRLLSAARGHLTWDPCRFCVWLCRRLGLVGPAGVARLGEEGARSLERLHTLACRFHRMHPGATMVDFLNYVYFLDLPDEEFDGTVVPKVTLSTIHSAKGREWSQVYLIGMEQGTLPSRMGETEQEREEERRVFYVGMTRAKDGLVMTACRRRGGHGPLLKLSEYLQELRRVGQVEVLSAVQTRRETESRYGRQRGAGCIAG